MKTESIQANLITASDLSENSRDTLMSGSNNNAATTDAGTKICAAFEAIFCSAQLAAHFAWAQQKQASAEIR